jgi:hypothetical protein
VAAWERDLNDVESAHEGWSEWFAFLVEGEGVEREVDVCDNGEISKVPLIETVEIKETYLGQHQR